MNITNLKTFVWIAHLGSFRKVAKKLHTTQPAISSRIASLEDELGIKLFVRIQGPAPMSLTAKGRDLLPFAEKMLLLEEQILQRGDVTRLNSGLLRLGVSETIVHSWLPDFLRKLNKEMPNLEVELTVDVTSELSKAVIDRSIDLAFLMGPVPDPAIKNLPLCHFPLVWIAGKDLEVPNRKLYLEELVNWPILTYARNTKPFTEISDCFNRLSTLPARFISSSSLAACYRLVMFNVGISALPKTMVQQGIDNGQVKQIDVTWSPSALNFTASYPISPYNSLVDEAARLALQCASEYDDSDMNPMFRSSS